MLVAKTLNIRDGLLRRSGEPDRFVLSAEFHQGGDLRPPREHKTAITAGGPAAADVLFEDDDVAVRFAVLDANGSPQPDVAASDDRHVRAGGTPERRRGRIVAEYLL